MIFCHSGTSSAVRTDGDVVLIPTAEVGLARLLLDLGLAKPWSGAGPRPTWTDAELAAIAART